MLRFPFSGFLVITIGQVMYRPPSCGQHCRIGNSSNEKSILADHFLARSRLHSLREKRSELGQLRQHFDFFEQALRRLHIQKPANAFRDFIEAIDFERQIHPPLAAHAN